MFERLSDEQRKIVFDKNGKFVVRACPGSGKTFSVAARFSRLLKSWENRNQGIAVISFTNVAHEQIEKDLELFNNGIPIKIKYPHFIGTIDSFINQYIFLPYGHLVMGCKRRPILVGEPHGQWNHEWFYHQCFDKFSFSLDGNLFLLDKRSLRANWNNDSRYEQTKKTLIKSGYATQLDANFFALKVLEKFPQIAKVIASRFPYLIIDEAQDTSDIQMKILDILEANGLNEIMLVGDPDQAIFEFNNANPKLLNEKFNSWPDSVVLNENRRSSQLICDLTHNLSSLEQPSIAVTREVSGFHCVPKVYSYENQLGNIIDNFLKDCESEGIEITTKKVAILFRSKNFVGDLFEQNIIDSNISPWKDKDFHTRDFAYGKFLHENGKFKEGFRVIEKGYLKLKLGKSYCSETDIDKAINDLGYRELKLIVSKILSNLPSVKNVTISDWILDANQKMSSISIVTNFNIKRNHKNKTFKELFSYQNSVIGSKDYRVGTIHSAKGETFDATLVILKKNSGQKAYKTYLNEGTSIVDSEELRTVYVGLTRPRKILHLAVPDEEDEVLWKKRFKIKDN